jgi:predicted phage terminase large subunit-like protein
MSESTPGRSTYNGGKTRVTDSSVLSSKLTPQDLQDLLALLPTMVPAERQTLLQKLQKFEELQARETAQTDFLSFVGRMWPEFIMGRHHKKMARAFERVANGKCKRLIINMPPRHTKSEFASYLLPAWFLGRFPQKKVIQTSHTAELAVGFGRKVRNLVGQDIYVDLFPDTALQADSKAAGRWNTSKGGDYFAIGVGGAVTGKGADLLIIDDPHSEQEATLAEHSPEIYDKVHEWYTSGPRQRLQPGGAIVIVMTRWSKRDLTGQVVKSSLEREGEEWEVIEFPAIMPSGNPLWPEFWPMDELSKLRNELPHSKWMAQYQQDPTAEGSAIVKRDWWRCWEEENPPACNFTLMSWDTAFEKNNRADYSACTVWGVFYRAETETFDVENTTEETRNKARTGIPQANIILLNAYRARLEFPELKRRVMDEYNIWDPDSVIIEKKASGAPLIYELRSMGVPVQEFTPTRGNDKISRLNAVSDIFASGRVWYPPRRWAEEVIEEVASFPAGEHDDYVDSTSQALMRFRKGGYIQTAMDEVDNYDTNAHRAYRQFNNRARYY